MKYWSIFLLMGAGCGDDSSTAPMGSSGAGSTSSAEDPTSSAIDSSSSHDDQDGSSTQSSDGSSDTSSESGSSTDDPYTLCEAAKSEIECEGTQIPSSREFQSPSCQWRDVYLVGAEMSCSLIDVEPRCILFYGSLQGCGGPGCEFPNAGEHYAREVDGVTEVLIYPEDDVCGPLPEASPSEPAWTSCADPVLPECDCLCEVL